MEQFFIVILVFLALLAAFDLFVGVSNDAVNFLNSAVGSRVAPFKVVILVASLGVLIGATFSSGMMEIARSGVFNPEMFTFSEIIVVFFAVMVTDVLLLDIFNSFGLPTSTTVSIVFELLGGAVAAAAYKIFSTPELSFQSIGDYINNEKALAIVSGILISVIVAFLAGAIIQYVLRLLFTFKYEKTYKYWGSSFGGVALTAIFYFLVMKGAKGASFMRPEFIDWINHHTISILIYTFLALTVVFQLLISLFRFNIFKVVILAGTFALAFAFAGNDLVNFVGVPLAALDSYKLYAASGMAANVFTMESLKEAVHTPTFYLLISGLIMVATLLFSKKAKRVVQTSINLSSSSRGAKEQFGSSIIGRRIVRSSIGFGKASIKCFSGSIRVYRQTNGKYVPKKGEVALPFDHIRASTNLVVASILIASATSLKLPLSTTYVTFMVAMGSSLADGAWDRESAVYRISGVLTVIGGWFFTAFSAFTLAVLVTTAVFFGETLAIIGLMLLVSFMMIYSNFFGKKEQKDDIENIDIIDRNVICNRVNSATEKYLTATMNLYNECITAFLNEDLKDLRRIRNSAIAIQDEISRKRGEYYRLALESSEQKVDRDARHYYYRVFTNLKEVGHGLRSVVGTAYNHVDNNHRVYKGALRENLEKMIADLHSLESALKEYVSTVGNNDIEMSKRQNESIALINQLQLELLQRIDEENLSLRGSELYLNFLQFSRDLINRFSLIALLQHELNEKVGKASK
ncbi:inorganic phosphate transporter [Porphyromonadaceae bacterium]